jgi:aminocarboxymuconate-semialdehyde decarboxylase
MTAVPSGDGSIDFHAHVVPERIWAEATRSGNAFQVSIESGGEREVLALTPERAGPVVREVHYTIEDRLAAMDAAGVGLQVVSASPLLFRYDLATDYAAGMCRDVNDELAALVSERGDRFRALANLPLPDVDAAIVELQRAVGELGLSGVEIDTRVGSSGWDEPEFDRFFAAADELEAVLFFHPSYSLVWELNPRYHLGNSIGNPTEDTLVIAALVYGGILQRYPRVTSVIAHGGGQIAFGIGRMDHGWKVRPEAREKLHEPPSRSLRKLYYDSITWSEPALRLLIDSVGADRVVMGSDWPYDMGPENPTAWVADMVSISDEEKSLILRENARRLLRLQG